MAAEYAEETKATARVAKATITVIDHFFHIEKREWGVACTRGKETARLLTMRAADMKDKGMKTTLESSMAKLYTSEVAVRCANESVQIHGGYGFIKDYVVEKLYRDQRVTEIYEGTSEIQRLVIARTVLGR